MEPKVNEKNSSQATEKKKVSKTWEAAKEYQGQGGFSYPKFVELTKQIEK